jgi:hypothetical protein
MRSACHFLRTFTLAVSLLLPAPVTALVEGFDLVDTRPSAGSMPLYAGAERASVVVSPADDTAVHHAARSLQADIGRVVGDTPALRVTDDPEGDRFAVIAGTLGRSPVIDRLIREGRVDVSAIIGRWEATLYAVVDDPYPGVARALIIAGSDRRGTVYGIYTLSEHLGVSPWSWWADVPVVRRESIHIRAGRHVDRGPAVKYRGIFLNDEAPALAGWAREKFGGFNSRFYPHVFELLLRLRANYLWPAMWGSSFGDDDPSNASLAHEYGIVMGTSHHEPLARAQVEWHRHGSGPWDYQRNADTLRSFWRGALERGRGFEQILTIGMRGDGDEPMSRTADINLLEAVVSDQRRLISEVWGRPASEVPQVWALYKEVQSYYEGGMRVPDDVTLLWADDNWGNIRRLPTRQEQGRAGGAGMYYHLDYVGGPRNYKWINVTPITKVWEQMYLAWRYGADRLWIVNVGDLKPMEFPMEFFLTLAWDPARWPYERLGDYSAQWATREFGADHAAAIAAIVNGYAKLNRRRTPEMLDPKTLSLVNYREADRVLQEWRDLAATAQKLQGRLHPEQQDAYFQLVLYPVLASANIWELHVAAGRNRLYSVQGRAAANAEAQRVLRHMQRDAELADQYHGLGEGRWNLMMSQVKLGYTSWQQPPIEVAPAVHFVRPRRGAELAIALEGSERSWPAHDSGPAVLPPLDPYSGTRRWIEVFSRGTRAFPFTATGSAPWVRVSPASGTVEDTVRVEVDVDWPRVPREATEASVVIAGAGGADITVRVPLIRPPAPPRDGFVEIDRHVAIEAMHHTRAVTRDGVAWRALPGFGRGLGAVTPFPVDAAEAQPRGASPRLEYDVELVSAGPMKVEIQCAPSLDFQPGEGLRLAVSFDDAPPQVVRVGTEPGSKSWDQAVGESVRRLVTTHTIDKPGRHVLKLWFVTPGVVVERITIDAGGLRPSYLGPPESPRGPR